MNKTLVERLREAYICGRQSRELVCNYVALESIPDLACEASAVIFIVHHDKCKSLDYSPRTFLESLAYGCGYSLA